MIPFWLSCEYNWVHQSVLLFCIKRLTPIWTAPLQRDNGACVGIFSITSKVFFLGQNCFKHWFKIILKLDKKMLSIITIWMKPKNLNVWRKILLLQSTVGVCVCVSLCVWVCVWSGHPIHVGGLLVWTLTSYDCLLTPLHRIGCKTYSHDTENTFIDTENIHYDTVKRYNNYTGKEITELSQHHNVFIFCPPFCFPLWVWWVVSGGVGGA